MILALFACETHGAIVGANEIVPEEAWVVPCVDEGGTPHALVFGRAAEGCEGSRGPIEAEDPEDECPVLLDIMSRSGVCDPSSGVMVGSTSERSFVFWLSGLDEPGHLMGARGRGATFDDCVEEGDTGRFTRSAEVPGTAQVVVDDAAHDVAWLQLAFEGATGTLRADVCR